MTAALPSDAAASSEAVPVVYFDGLLPAPGYTDYVRAYVSRSLPGKDQAVVLKHELAHIYMQHLTRGLAVMPAAVRLRQESQGQAFVRKAWNIACDMEIATHIYTDDDNTWLTSTFSMLAPMVPITRASCARFPLCEYAEEFFEELLAQGVVEEQSHDGDANDAAETAADGVYNAAVGVDVPAVVADASRRIESALAAAAAHKGLVQAVREPPRPTLASTIDRYLGRAAVTRAPSYRRPPRREREAADIIKPGRVCKPMTPAVTIYVDRSGSFDASKTFAAEEALKSVLLKYRSRITRDVLYFSDTVYTKDSPMYGGGGTNYAAVWDNIVKDRSAALSIVITDSDPCGALAMPKVAPEVIVVHIGGGSNSFAAAANAAVVHMDNA